MTLIADVWNNSTDDSESQDTTGTFSHVPLASV